MSYCYIPDLRVCWDLFKVYVYHGHNPDPFRQSSAENRMSGGAKAACLPLNQLWVHPASPQVSCTAGSPSPHHRPAAQYQKLLSQIGRELSPWQDSGITLEMVERAYCTNYEKSFRFQACALASCIS